MSPSRRKDGEPSPIPVTTAAQRVKTLVTNVHLLEGQLALLERASRDGELSILTGRSTIVDIAQKVLAEMHFELYWLDNAQGLNRIDAPDDDERVEVRS